MDIKNFADAKTNLLSGLTVALALVPEAIAFAFVAQVHPLVGLYAAFMVGLITSLIGGRPGMISGAAGALAVVMVALVVQHGVEYLFAAVVLMGVLQIAFGLAKLGKFIRMVPHPVMLGFVNGLAIVIFLAQMGHFKTADGAWMSGAPLYTMLALIALTMAVIYLLPRLTTAIPSALAAIVATSLLVIFAGIDTKTVGDMASIAGGLPQFHIPDVPFDWETLKIVFPYSLILAAIGLIESLLTLNLIDTITDTRGKPNRACVGQGVANVATGFFGGMGGCAMIGQTMINVKVSGARTRISTFLAGVFLLILVVALGDIVALIPMAALVAVMIMVSVATLDWHSIHPRTLKLLPRSETLVMLVTVVATVATHNLAIGVILGVVTAMVLFARRVAHMISIEKVSEADTDHDGTVDTRVYKVHGELFFASSNDLIYQFDYVGDPRNVVIDLTGADIWDASTVATLDAIRHKYAAKGKHVEIVGLDGASLDRLDRLSGRLGDGH